MGTFTILDSVKAQILFEIKKQLNMRGMDFYEQVLVVPVKDFIDYLERGVSSLDIRIADTSQLIGTLNFKNSTFERTSRLRKIAWSIYLYESKLEGNALFIKSAIEGACASIRIRIITNIK